MMMMMSVFVAVICTAVCCVIKHTWTRPSDTAAEDWYCAGVLFVVVFREQWLIVMYADADIVNGVFGRMQDMAEHISKLTETQQLYQDAISLKERELNVCALIVYRMTRSYLVKALDCHLLTSVRFFPRPYSVIGDIRKGIVPIFLQSIPSHRWTFQALSKRNLFTWDNKMCTFELWIVVAFEVDCNSVTFDSCNTPPPHGVVTQTTWAAICAEQCCRHWDVPMLSHCYTHSIGCRSSSTSNIRWQCWLTKSTALPHRCTSAVTLSRVIMCGDWLMTAPLVL